MGNKELIANLRRLNDPAASDDSITTEDAVSWIDAAADALEAAESPTTPVAGETEREALEPDFRLARSRGYKALVAECDFTGHMESGRRTAYYEGFKVGQDYPHVTPVAAESPTTVEWGVRIDGERPSETKVFDNEWAARDCAQNDKAWCSDAPRIVETRTVQRGQWGPTS